MPGRKPRALLSWSSGKDAAWALNRVRSGNEFDLRGLVTTLNGDADRVAMHAVRRHLLEEQAERTGLPLHTVSLPENCSNEDYESLVGSALRKLAGSQAITHVIFGDLFLADIRAYRERQMAELGLEPVFPLWGRDTRDLAHEMIEGGLQAVVTCVDTHQLAADFSGRPFGDEFLDRLPPGVDACGENGEFHTLVTDGPMFSHPMSVKKGDFHRAGQFQFTDFTAEKQ